MIAMYTVAVSAPVRRSLPACALVAVVMWAHVWAELARGAVSVGYAAETLPWMGWLALPWAVGVIVQGRRGARTHARVESERERAYDERLRIAQEVHDTVGHGLAAIAMQAGVALHVLDNRPGEARAALEAIRQASRESLSDLRHTLDVVRSSGPRLGRVADLAARCGIPVDVRVTGMPVRLPATVDLAAYRIVQESLTNVLRHSGADRAEVAIAYGAGDVTVEVTDDGRSGASAVETGLGIAGMRARAVGVGGTLVAGPVPGRGFRVRARLPVEAPS
jgi:signal transduction histidine kinase